MVITSLSNGVIDIRDQNLVKSSLEAKMAWILVYGKEELWKDNKSKIPICCTKKYMFNLPIANGPRIPILDAS